MRAGLDKPQLLAFIDAVGRSAEGPGRVYLVSGATALLLGVRDAIIDVDLKLDPEPKGIFKAISRLKERLSIHVKLASPDLFLPPLPGWQARREFVAQSGPVDFYHYDFYAQALSKLLRGHGADLADAVAYIRLGKVDPRRLLELFVEIRDGLIRYPAIDPGEFESRIRGFVEAHG